MNHCLYCGSRINWIGDLDAREVGFDHDGVTTLYHCCDYEGCGACYEITLLFEFEGKFIFNIYFVGENV